MSVARGLAALNHGYSRFGAPRRDIGGPRPRAIRRRPIAFWRFVARPRGVAATRLVAVCPVTRGLPPRDHVRSRSALRAVPSVTEASCRSTTANPVLALRGETERCRRYAARGCVSDDRGLAALNHGYSRFGAPRRDIGDPWPRCARPRLFTFRRSAPRRR